MDTKFCSKCKKEFPATLEHFTSNKTNSSGLASRCKSCEKEYRDSRLEITSAQRREFRKNNKQKLAEVNRKYNADVKNKIKVRSNNVQRNYGISLDIVQEMMDSQKGCCAICKDSLVSPDNSQPYHIDHNHTTGMVRSLLCHQCNLAIGKFKEDKTILMSAIAYLEKHNG